VLSTDALKNFETKTNKCDDEESMDAMSRAQKIVTLKRTIDQKSTRSRSTTFSELV